MRILIVDDEAMQRELLQGFLEKKGYATAVAAGGEEALRRFAELPYQLVLLDDKMPDMTGDEVLARMKELNPLVHAIKITA
jgi:two-component system response regulator AtoC